ncbi:hypothetical protein L3Y34_019510 [Caenorhabditis briggsae]|uniref:Homeobox domain-containing protein n=1 Tax=Caenorhabditis briggsae TaxID=6238 RepID=A0AAE9DQ35_CAEBR|nr:hypothetical protein L3Y34_019510 [Caenorhabditis briggsae]
MSSPAAKTPRTQKSSSSSLKYPLGEEVVKVLEESFEDFQYLTEKRMSKIKSQIGHCFENQEISEWFAARRLQEIEKDGEGPRAYERLPVEMAFLHFTYDREPNVKKLNFFTWAKVHVISETDIRTYYKERAERDKIRGVVLPSEEDAEEESSPPSSPGPFRRPRGRSSSGATPLFKKPKKN